MESKVTLGNHNTTDKINPSLKLDFTEIKINLENIKREYEHGMRVSFKGTEPQRESEIVADYLEIKGKIIKNRSIITTTGTSLEIFPEDELVIMFMNDNVYPTSNVREIIDYDTFVINYNKIVKKFEHYTLPRLDRDQLNEDKFFDDIHCGKYCIPDRHRISISAETAHSYHTIITEFEKSMKRLEEKLENHS